MDNEAQIRRMMLGSLEAEQAVIGAVLMDRDAIIAATETIHKDDFYYNSYGTLFEAMKELLDAGQAVDTITLQNKLREKDTREEKKMQNQEDPLAWSADFIFFLPTSRKKYDYC